MRVNAKVCANCNCVWDNDADKCTNPFCGDPSQWKRREDERNNAYAKPLFPRTVKRKPKRA